MSCSPCSPDGNDDYIVQQENELEALASIFGDDFEDLRAKQPWKVQVPKIQYTCINELLKLSSDYVVLITFTTQIFDNLSISGIVIWLEKMASLRAGVFEFTNRNTCVDVMLMWFMSLPNRLKDPPRYSSNYDRKV